MANIDPFDVEFDDEEYNKPTGANIDPFDVDKEQKKADWKVGVFDNALKRMKKPKPSMREMLYNNPEDAKKFEEMSANAGLSPEGKALLKEAFDNSEINVPEIDTKVVDLPKEDENEKELIVEHNDTSTEPMAEPSDTTIAEPTPQKGNAELENFDESEVVEPPTEENAVSGEEVGDKTVYPETEEEEPKTEEPVDPAYKEALEEAQALAQDDLEGYRVPKNWKDWTAKQKADSIKAFMENRKKAEKEKPKETKEPMSEEDILAEAEAIAQKPLPGFRPPANWGDLSFEEKGKIVKAYDDTKKVEDHRTNIDDSETNNFEAYKRYPTGLRFTEDLVGAGGKMLEGAGDVAKTEIGGTGANMISERAKGVPHYDYTSLFGRR